MEEVRGDVRHGDSSLAEDGVSSRRSRGQLARGALNRASTFEPYVRDRKAGNAAGSYLGNRILFAQFSFHGFIARCVVA